MNTAHANTTASVLAKSENNLVWLDCEMTGLNPKEDRLLEIAVVVTDPHVQIRVAGPVFAIHQSQAQLDKMDAWNQGRGSPLSAPSDAI